MSMVYIVNVFDKKSKDIRKSFEVESADEAAQLDSRYSVLGFDVSVEPDVLAYMDKYRPPQKRHRRTKAEMLAALSCPA
jgi:hypothetical protein